MRISRYQTKRYVLPFTALVLFILLSAIVAPRMRFGRYSPLAHYFDRAQIQRFADAIGAPKGSVLIEYDAVHEAESFAFGAELAARGTDVAFTILRESTPTSIFAIPIRNSFSRSRESAGVFSMLAFDEEFLTQPIETRIARAQMMGVSHVAVRSPLMKAALATTSMTKLVTEYGGWKVFQFADPAPRARVLQYKPVAVYSDLRFNSRTTETADYTRMVEEMMRRNQWDPLLVFPRDQQLDGNLTLQDFSSVIIEQYHYRNRDTAYRRLKEFVTGGGTLFVYRSDDPLYSMLTSLAREGDISIVERKYIGPYRYPREEYGALFDMLPLKSTNAQAGATPRATAEYTALSINVRISSTSTELPILVQTSFFPAWHRQGTSEPHLAGPNFMLAFADTDFRLNFEIPASVRVGILVSAASIIMLILSNFRRIPYTFRSGDSL